jgi:hypothetical protein
MCGSSNCSNWNPNDPSTDAISDNGWATDQQVNMYLQGYTEDIDFNVFFDNELFFQMSKKDTPEIIQNVISGSGMERVFACICL